ncbi:unnamed protein product [Prorocentrum cordatum]|uniref:Uncharacterized protein n=1 Tax=Prorocentrum cordatum TaxID=2364126 RepID=A0ABN9XKK4_9DINO|nr:unnamed protein product [Polarella glacialis]
MNAAPNPRSQPRVTDARTMQHLETREREWTHSLFFRSWPAPRTNLRGTDENAKKHPKSWRRALGNDWGTRLDEKEGDDDDDDDDAKERERGLQEAKRRRGERLELAPAA